jgi:hypothetical protein
LKTSLKNFEIGGGAVLLLWANTFSPFGMNRQKRILVSEIKALLTFSPMAQQYISEDYTNMERWRNTGKEE